MEQPVKRRPGRPPKASKAPPITKFGVVNSPCDSKNIFEVSHTKPVLWKNLFGFFQSLKAVDICIKCAPDGLTFYTMDYTKNIRVLARFDVAELEWYYCQSEFHMGVNQGDVEGIFKIIDDSFCRIMIERLRANPTQIKITLTDPSINKDNIFSVRVMVPPPDPKLLELDTIFNGRDESDIAFTLLNRNLKKSMEIASKQSSTARIDCVGNSGLRIIYNSNDFQITGTEAYRDDKAIKLRSNLKEGGYIQVQFQISLVKSFTDANKFESVQVYGSNGGQPLIMVTENIPLGICCVIETDPL